MTEEQFLALEGGPTTEEEFSFFVSRSKEKDFFKLLRKYNLERDITSVKKGTNLSMFLLDIRKRVDFREVQNILNDRQPDFLEKFCLQN